MHCFVIMQGQCLGKGTFEEMSNSGIDFSSLLKTNEEEEEKEKPPPVVYERATSVEHAHSSLQNIGSTFSLTSIGTEFEVNIFFKPQDFQYLGLSSDSLHSLLFVSFASNCRHVCIF